MQGFELFVLINVVYVDYIPLIPAVLGSQRSDGAYLQEAPVKSPLTEAC